MNHSDNRPSLWTEAAVEDLLTEFFDSEMPPALKRLRFEPVEHRRSAGSTQLAALVVTALSVLALAAVFVRSPAPHGPNKPPAFTGPADEIRGGDARRADATHPMVRVPEESKRGYLVGAPAPQAADDSIGPRPVELQGELSWTELRLHDPTISRNPDSIPPELMIEIYPIEGVQ